MPKMQFGRTPEAIDYLEEFVERGEKIPEAQRHPVGRIGTFNRPTDVTWDSQDNIYVSDGYGNSRVVKITQGRPLGEDGGHVRVRPGSVHHPAQHRLGQAGQHLRRRPQQLAHPGL